MPQNQKKKNKVVQQHAFKRVRDPLVVNATAATPGMVSLTTDGSGNGSQTLTLSPVGLYGAASSPATAGQVATWSSAALQSPYLPWLYNQSRNFERYRVMNATLIAVGNLGSSATGRILLDSSTDMADNITVVTTATSTGGKVFDVGQLASREARLPLDVDSSWKKVSSRTFLFDASNTALLPVSSANDLSFSNVYMACYGASASSSAPVAGTIVAQFYLEYDVEFRDPISYGVNA